MASDTFPLALNALYAAALGQNGAGGTLAGMLVVLGQLPQQSANLNRLFIGASGDATAADGDNSGDDGFFDKEVFSILSVAEAQGDLLANNINTVWGMRTAVRSLIRPDASGLTLGIPALASARMGAWSLEIAQPKTGGYVGLTFRVECVCKTVAS